MNEKAVIKPECCENGRVYIVYSGYSDSWLMNTKRTMYLDGVRVKFCPFCGIKFPKRQLSKETQRAFREDDALMGVYDDRGFITKEMRAKVRKAAIERSNDRRERLG